MSGTNESPIDVDALEVKPSSGKRLAGIEGLRAAAALSVMLGHFNLHLVPGEMIPPLARHLLNVAGQGLTLFFVLSGFLLFGPFLTAAAQRRPFDVSRYFANRFLRIYPAYVTIFLIVACGLGLAYMSPIAAANTGAEGVGETVGRMTDVGAILANVFLVHTLTPWTIKTGLGVSWSLTAEICFYLLLPVLAVAAVRLSGRWGLSRAAIVISVAMIVVGLLCRTIGNMQVHGDAAAQFYQQWGGTWLAVYLRSILCQADLFGLGMLAAVGYRHSLTLSAHEARLRFRRWLYVAAAAAAVLTRIEYEFGFAMFFAAIVLIVTTETASGRPQWLVKLVEWHPIRWIGVISYSFYLWHLPVIWGVHKWLLDGSRPHTLPLVLLSFAAVLLVTIGLSAITYLAVERPALLLKTRPARKRSADALALRGTAN
ncbi:MAG: acyltransferase [Pseudolabrys sp.]|jgi:peptidoglycan/LPS O-acetylase OafA/YrhL